MSSLDSSLQRSVETTCCGGFAGYDNSLSKLACACYTGNAGTILPVGGQTLTQFPI